MKNRTLLAVGISAIVLAFIGPAMAGGINGQGSGFWGPFDQMRTEYMGGASPGHFGMMFGGDYGSPDAAPSIDGAQEIEVQLDDFSISPSQVVVVEGQPANITVVNTGSAPHDFSVPDLGISIFVAPGATVTAGIPAQSIGTYDALCTIPGHEALGMIGSFVVQDQA